MSMYQKLISFDVLESHFFFDKLKYVQKQSLNIS